MSKQEEPKETVGEKLARRYGEDVEKAVLKIAREDNPVMALVCVNELRRLLAEIAEYANDLDRAAIRGVVSVYKGMGLQ